MKSMGGVLGDWNPGPQDGNFNEPVGSVFVSW